ncbi:MAG: deoxyribonuclease IV [Candidatus Babeliales bacterium]|nr:deoxyribonuclease IV [Candidatus Babeliales bacterium]
MQKNKHTLLLGAHMSIAQNFEHALQLGESIGCTAIQIFTKSNRQWVAKKISDQQAASFHEALKKTTIKSVITHATYLINIGSPDSATSKKSTAALIDELERCALLTIPYLVLHPGASLKTNEQECLERIADNINEALAKTPHTTNLLLETMAGQGSTIGNTFEQLALIREKVETKSRLGICFDTCHAFAAGYDFRTSQTYNKMWADFDATIGLTNLKAMHLNDSKKELGSHVDRHDDIGKGQLGLKVFELLVNDERFFDIPKILETPKTTGLLEDKKNMETIKSLISLKTRKALDMEESE